MIFHSSIMYNSQKMETILRVVHLTNKLISTIDSELQYKRKLLTVPWKGKRSNQFILNKINPEYSLEGLMLKLNP